MRAICCLAVFIEHFTASFNMSSLKAFREITGYSLFTYLNDGRLAINMFCTISGFLIVYHAFDGTGRNINFDKLRYSFIKRVLYMYIPCAFICIISFCFVKFDMLGNTKAFEMGADSYIIGIYNAEPTLVSLVECLLGIIGVGRTVYSPQLWTMRLDIWCGSVCLILLLIAGNKKTLRWIFYIAYLLVTILVIKNNYYEAFACGMIAAELCRNKVVLNNRIIGYIGVVLSLTLASASYKIGGRHALLIPIFSACFLYFGHGIWSKCTKLIWPLEKMRVFGTYSYSFYMIHFTLIVSMSAELYILLVERIGILATFIINIVCSFTIITILAVLFQRYFVDKLSYLINKVYLKMK